MAKYEVTLKETNVYVLEVELDSEDMEDEAIDKAWEMLIDSESDGKKDNRSAYFNDNESDADAVELSDE